MNVPLPLATRILIQISLCVQSFLVVEWFLVVVAAYLLFRRFRSTEEGRRKLIIGR